MKLSIKAEFEVCRDFSTEIREREVCVHLFLSNSKGSNYMLDMSKVMKMNK